MSNKDFKFVLQAAEGQFIEFKGFFDKSISKEIVAFANASGGRIYLGITDTGVIKGIIKENYSFLKRSLGKKASHETDYSPICYPEPNTWKKQEQALKGFVMPVSRMATR